MLLDTCVVQNIEWVYARHSEDREWTSSEEESLVARYGKPHANELLALWDLVGAFEEASSTLPWLVSESAREELNRHPGTKRARLVQGWSYWDESADEWGIEAFGTVAPSSLRSGLTNVHPLVLRGLGVSSYEQIIDSDGPLSEFRDEGDRKIIRDALVCGVRAILTTDLRSFWNERAALDPYGIEIWRPTDLLVAYESRWQLERTQRFTGADAGQSHS